MAHRSKSPLPVIPSNSMVASAVRYTGVPTRVYFGGQDWQSECYRHYAICGEARFAARFYGHALSRAVLGVGVKNNGRMEWSESGAPKNLLDELFNGKDGQAQMLEAIGVHLSIAGECYLIGRSAMDDLGQMAEIWEIVSVKEIKVSGTKWTLSVGADDVVLEEEDVVIRMWVPDPINRLAADSPFRSLLPILAEIEWLTKSIFAQTSSRLTGAGMLVLPQGLSFPPPPDINGKPQQYANEAEGLMLTLANAMEKAITDPGHPASKVPIMVMAPGDAIASIRLIQFWSELDSVSMDLRNEAIRRFALGMDVPPEQILGMASNIGAGGGTSNGVSHWGAWQIEEQTIKMHIEPLLDTVVNALTVSYLRPLSPGTKEIVFYDTSALRLRPDRSREAMELYDRGELAGRVMLSENGFDSDADAPTEKEYQKFLLKKIAGGSATPEQVYEAAKQLGVDLGEPQTDQQPRESRPDPSMEDHPSDREEPEAARGRSQELAVIAACDALVWRALEKAGNRVLNAGTRGKNRDKTIEPTEFYFHVTDKVPDGLFDGAFTYSPHILGEYGDADEITRMLKAYCQTLLATGARHSRKNLAEFLELNGLTTYQKPEKAVEPAHQPISLTVNVEGSTNPVTVQLPDGLVQMAAPIATSPNVEVINNVPIPNVEVVNQLPETTVNVDVAAPHVEVENLVPTPSVTVEGTTVNVDAPIVNVDAPKVEVKPQIEVKPAPVKVIERSPKETRVIRDSDDKIIGVKEVE